MWEQFSPRREGSNPLLEEKLFNDGVFRKNSSKYAKLMVELYACDNLNQIYHFFSFLTKRF